eukprot:6473776-Amphidinium_carterae.1
MLNGQRTRVAEGQRHAQWYRWNMTQARDFLTGAEKDMSTEEIDRIVEESEVKDWHGGWTPVALLDRASGGKIVSSAPLGAP